MKRNHYERWGNSGLDRIDKAVLILPFMPLADMVSTLFGLTLGGHEGGIVAKPIYDRYGKPGLVALLTFIFLFLLACMWLFIIDKRRVQMQASRRERVALVVGINFLFLVEGLWMAAVITNLILPPSVLAMRAIWLGVIFAYFVSVSFFTRAEMRRLITR